MMVGVAGEEDEAKGRVDVVGGGGGWDAKRAGGTPLS